MAVVESIASAVSNVFGLISGRNVLRNAPEMKTNKTAKVDAQVKETSVEAVQEAQAGNLDKLRKLTAE